MERPQVRQTETQRVEQEREITGWEAEELLRKYGYTEEFTTTRQNEPPKPPPMTFEEMVALEEEAKKKQPKASNGPRPITFDGNNGYDSRTTYGSDDELGFGFKIEVISDMKLPNY